MLTVTISPKFQVVIPKEIRERLGLRPGQKVQALLHEGRIELIPIGRMKSLRGLFPGIETSVERDRDRA